MNRRSFVSEALNQAAKYVFGDFFKIDLFKKQVPPLKPQDVLSVVKQGSAINLSKDVFGKGLTCFLTVPLDPVAMDPNQNAVLAVCGHKDGFSTLRFFWEEQNQRWCFDFQSTDNKRWNLNAEVAFDLPLKSGAQLSPGVGEVLTSCSTPWGTVLLGEASGYLMELDLKKDLLLKRTLFENCGSELFRIRVEPGKPVQVIFHNRIFTSAESYHPRSMNSHLLLSAGQWEDLRLKKPNPI